MRATCRSLVMLVPVLLVGLVAVSTAAAAAAPVPTTRQQVGFLTGTATQGELEDAVPLEEHLAGLSELEPPLCRDVLETTRDVDPGTAGAGSITISPASTEFEDLEPATTYSHCFVAHNRSSETREYELSTFDITGSPDPDQQQLVVDPPQALGSWVRPALRTFSLAPGERIYVPYLLETPSDLPAGTLTAAIRVTQLPQGEEPVGGAVIQPSVSQRLHLTMPGGRATELVVSRVRAPRMLSHDDAPIAYRARFVVTNEGTVLDSYEVDLDVTGLGRRVGGAEVGPATVLPGGANEVVLTWRGLPWIGWYRPHAKVISRAGTVDVELPGLLILPARPWLIAIIVALLLPIIALVVRWRRRREEWRRYLDEEGADDGLDEAWDDGTDWR